MTYTYDAFKIDGKVILIKRSRIGNLRNDSDTMSDLIEASYIIDKDLETVNETMDFIDVVQMRTKEANTYDMDEISFIKDMTNVSLNFINISMLDLMVMALAKCADHERIFYIGVVSEDSELFDSDPIVIG